METTPKPTAKHGSETRQKSAPPLSVRVSPAERAEIEAAAEAANLTIASYIRETVLRAPQTKKVRRPSLDRALLAQMLGQLGKVGGNLNQIAHRLNEGRGVGAARIEAAVEDFKELRKEIIIALRKLE